MSSDTYASLLPLVKRVYDEKEWLMGTPKKVHVLAVGWLT